MSDDVFEAYVREAITEAASCSGELVLSPAATPVEKREAIAEVLFLAWRENDLEWKDSAAQDFWRERADEYLHMHATLSAAGLVKK